MNIPIIETKGIEEKGIITAEMTLKNIKKLPKHIDCAVLLFENSTDEEIISNRELLFYFKAASSTLPQYVYKNKIVLAYSPLGGPAAGGLVEELIAYGIKKIIACGSSGLIGEIDASNFLLVTKAIRDEGLSYHYLEPSTYVEASYNLNKTIEKYLTLKKLKYTEGITWTTDAFYRETKTRVNIRKSQGAVAVEMECASMAAVCKYHEIEFSQILYFSDIVKQDSWSGFRVDRKSIKDSINHEVIDIAMKL